MNGHKGISDATMQTAYNATLKKFQISDAQQKTCENNSVFGKSISAQTALALEVRTEDKVPVVIYNGQYDPEHRYSKIYQRMR